MDDHRQRGDTDAERTTESDAASATSVRPLPRVETRRRILYAAPAVIGTFLLASRAEAATSCTPHVDCQPLLCNPYAPL